MMMPPSFGYWLDPLTGQCYSVTTHQQWVLDHAASLGIEDLVAGLDPQQDQDEIRLSGCKAGLIRVRDYGLRMSVQFWLPEQDRISSFLRTVRCFMQTTGAGPMKSMWFNNLATSDEVTLLASEFIELVESSGDVFPTRQ